MTNNNDGGVSVSRRPLPQHVPGPRLGPRDIGLRNERYRWFGLGHCWFPLTVHGVPVLLKCVEFPGDLGLFPETANAPLTGPTAMPAAAAQTVRNKQMRFLTLCHLLLLLPITPHFARAFQRFLRKCWVETKGALIHLNARWAAGYHRIVALRDLPHICY